MKHLNIILSAFVLIGALPSFGQSILSVSPGLGTLNDAIDGDTLANGERVDPQRIYEVQDGGFYGLVRTIENDGYDLHIRLAAGSEERAILQPIAGDGGEASRAFEARGNMILEGLEVLNVDQIGVLQERMIRLRVDDIKVTVDNCLMQIDDQTAFRADENNGSIFITNSIFANIGQGNDPDDGRFIDDRGNDLDSLVIENSIVYNITSRFLRDGGGTIDYAFVNQNTFVNSSQRGFDFGIVREMTFTNNLVVNGSFEGIDEPEEPGLPSEGFVTVDEWLPDPPAQSLTITNNNTFTESALTDLYPDGLIPVPLFDSTAVLLNATIADNISEPLTFTDGPAAPTQYLQDFFDDNIPNSATWWDDDSDFPFFPTYDFSYSTSFDSYTGGTDGQPIGALQDFSLSTTERNSIEFGLYPIPAQDQLFVDIPEKADINVIRVFNILGAEVASFPANNAGLQILDITNLKSGLYIISLVQADGNMSSKKFVVD